jgi:predicted DNA-binding protein
MPKVKKQISLFVEPEQLQTLQTLSEVTLAPVGALIRAAIDDYLEKRKAEIKSVKK